MGQDGDRVLQLLKQIEAEKKKIADIKAEVQIILDHTQIPGDNQRRLDDVRSPPAGSGKPASTPSGGDTKAGEGDARKKGGKNVAGPVQGPVLAPAPAPQPAPKAAEPENPLQLPPKDHIIPKQPRPRKRKVAYPDQHGGAGLTSDTTGGGPPPKEGITPGANSGTPPPAPATTEPPIGVPYSEPVHPEVLKVATALAVGEATGTMQKMIEADKKGELPSLLEGIENDKKKSKRK